MEVRGEGEVKEEKTRGQRREWEEKENGPAETRFCVVPRYLPRRRALAGGRRQGRRHPRSIGRRSGASYAQPPPRRVGWGAEGPRKGSGGGERGGAEEAQPSHPRPPVKERGCLARMVKKKNGGTGCAERPQ